MMLVCTPSEWFRMFSLELEGISLPAVTQICLHIYQMPMAQFGHHLNS